MKIGILTLPIELNYGGILQNYALQEVLRDLGHDPITINRHNKRVYGSRMTQILGFIKRNIQRYILRKNVSSKWNPFISDEEYAEKSKEIKKFISNNINLTESIYSDELDVVDGNYQFDAYVVGSDQVWLDYYCPASFLDFVKRDNVIKLTYAASCNESKSIFNNKSKLLRCATLSKNFDGISVRERSLVNLCSKYLGVTAEFVVDPTMLLSYQHYERLSLNRKVVDNKYIYVYILDVNENKRKLISQISEYYGYEIIYGNEIDNTVSKISVEKWLSYMLQAEFIITDSFHGTVFSIIFNKQFITILNPDRGANRFHSLLSLFHLENRMVFESAYLSQLLLENLINYDNVNKILDSERSNSLNFIKRCLGNTKVTF